MNQISVSPEGEIIICYNDQELNLDVLLDLQVSDREKQEILELFLCDHHDQIFMYICDLKPRIMNKYSDFCNNVHVANILSESLFLSFHGAGPEPHTQ